MQLVNGKAETLLRFCDSWSNFIPFPQHSQMYTKRQMNEDVKKHFLTEDFAEHLCELLTDEVRSTTS